MNGFRLLPRLGTLAAALGLAAASPALGGPLPVYDHVVVVIEENHDYSEIIGNSAAPYINQLALAGASFTDAHGVEHPSLPNYLDLFSGSNQGITSDTNPDQFKPPLAPFSTDNLRSELAGVGKTFGSYSEGLPSVGSTADNAADPSMAKPNPVDYARKHNAAVDWQPTDPSHPQPNAVPASENMPFAGFFPTNAAGFASLPTVSFVAPNQQNDMHGVSGGLQGNALITAGDTWLKNNIGSYADWAKTHNSLLMVVFDENDFTAANHIPMLFYGAGVVTGQYNDHINHFNTLRTLEEMYGAGYAGQSANAPAIRDAFGAGGAVPEPGSICLMGIGGIVGLGVLVRRRLKRS